MPVMVFNGSGLSVPNPPADNSESLQIVEREITLREPGMLDELEVTLGKVIHQTEQGDSTSLVLTPIVRGEYPVQLEWRGDSD